MRYDGDEDIARDPLMRRDAEDIAERLLNDGKALELIADYLQGMISAAALGAAVETMADNIEEDLNADSEID